jgi:hypothetical protein
MRKTTLLVLGMAAIVALVAGFALAGDEAKAAGKSISINGWITDSFCANEAVSEKTKECALKCLEKGAKLVLVIPDSKKSYALDDQKLAKEHLGHEVKVTGTVDETAGSIKVDKIEAATQEKKG